jgi:hypothetical protein
MKSAVVAVLLLALSAPALAQLEGVAEFKGSVNAGRGKPISSAGKVYVTRNASRVEWEMDMKALGERKGAPKGAMPSSYRMVTIQKLSDPDRIINLNDERKTYAVTDLRTLREGQPAAPQATYTVKKLGRDSVAGFSCEKAVVSSSEGTRSEICVADQISQSSGWLAAQSRRERSSGLLKALHDNGLQGFPVRWVVWARAGDPQPATTMELVRFEKKSLPSSLFEVPAGYTQVTGASRSLTPEREKSMKEADRKMKEAIEKLPPEQRKQYEEMMKKRRSKEDD